MHRQTHIKITEGSVLLPNLFDVQLSNRLFTAIHLCLVGESIHQVTCWHVY